MKWGGLGIRAEHDEVVIPLATRDLFASWLIEVEQRIRVTTVFRDGRGGVYGFAHVAIVVGEILGRRESDDCAHRARCQIVQVYSSSAE